MSGHTYMLIYLAWKKQNYPHFILFSETKFPIFGNPKRTNIPYVGE